MRSPAAPRNAAEVLDALARGGVSLTLTEDGRILCAGPRPAREVLTAAREHREGIAEFLSDRRALRARGYSPTEAERLARGLLDRSPDLLLVGVKPGRLDGRALKRRMGSRFA